MSRATHGKGQLERFSVVRVSHSRVDYAKGSSFISQRSPGLWDAFLSGAA